MIADEHKKGLFGLLVALDVQTDVWSWPPKPVLKTKDSQVL